MAEEDNDIDVVGEKAALGIVSLILNKQPPHHRPDFVSAAVFHLLGFFPCLGNDEASPEVLRLGNDKESQCGAPRQTGMKLNRLLKFYGEIVPFHSSVSVVVQGCFWGTIVVECG